MMGSQTRSYYSERGKATYMGKGRAKLRSLQRQLFTGHEGLEL